MSETEKRLRAALDGRGLSDIGLIHYSVTDSTNLRAMECAEENRVTLFVADSQSAGRGRLGRSFLSPEGGLYMSLLFHPKSGCADASTVTAATAVAAVRVLCRFTELDLKIKWVNDIYFNDKKLAGILTQGRTNTDGSLDCAVIGIGLNLYRRDLGELSAIATSVEEAGGGIIPKEELAAELTREILSVIDNPTAVSLVEEYRRLSYLQGRTVTVIRADKAEYSARVVGIDGNYRLLLDREGEIVSLSTGEVSVRPTE